MAREIHDHYFKQAKRDGYRSRAAYKLIEIDDRRKVLAPGQRVLDCGCAPGSWIQVAAKRVGRRGVVVGIDLQTVPGGAGFENAHVLQGDFNELTDDELKGASGRPFDVVLSDMAPKTTGDPFGDHHQSVRLVHALLDRVPGLLAPGGALVAKVFEGEAYPDLLQRAKEMFETVKGFKPKASRNESREMFVVAKGRR